MEIRIKQTSFVKEYTRVQIQNLVKPKGDMWLEVHLMVVERFKEYV